MATAYTRFINDAKEKANKLLLEEQQENLLGTIEVNPGDDEMEVEEGDEELVEKVKNREDLTSLESEEKNEEVETILEMTPWAFVQEELPSEDIPYILEVEELIVSFHEIKEASIANKMIK